MLTCVFFPLQHDVEDCEKYTEEFGGGQHHFHGAEYFIEICKIGISENANFMILKVFDSKKNKVLARRSITDDTYLREPIKLEFSNSGFRYVTLANPANRDFEEIFFSFPPTWWDKFKANYTNLD
jgi:hypothetical protein